MTTRANHINTIVLLMQKVLNYTDRLVALAEITPQDEKDKQIREDLEEDKIADWKADLDEETNRRARKAALRREKQVVEFDEAMESTPAEIAAEEKSSKAAGAAEERQMRADGTSRNISSSSSNVPLPPLSQFSYLSGDAPMSESTGSFLGIASNSNSSSSRSTPAPIPSQGASPSPPMFAVALSSKAPQAAPLTGAAVMQRTNKKVSIYTHPHSIRNTAPRHIHTTHTSDTHPHSTRNTAPRHIHTARISDTHTRTQMTYT
jgi:hypothetical protein